MSPPRLLPAMSARLPVPRFPFILLFVFLAVQAPASSHGDPAPPLTTYDASMCPESSMCGNVSIKYPFYLSSTIGDIADYSYNTTLYSCGYTDLMISCQYEGPKETPVIFLRGHHQYTVLNISYDSNTIILAESDVLAAGSCPAVHHDLSFDKLWLNNTSSNDNLTFYFGCYASSGPVEVPPDLGKYRIDCNLKGPFGDGASFVFTSDNHGKAQERELDQDGRCWDVVSVPVRSEILMASNQSMLASGGYAEVISYGFELEWYPTATDQCHLCEQPGGKCAYSYNQKREFLGCLCSNSKVGHPDCRSRRSKKVQKGVIIGVSAAAGLGVLAAAAILFIMRKRKKNEPRIESFLQKNGKLHPKRHTYADVKRMTKSFAVKLGQGGFGAVYKGNLSNGSQVAVKMLKDTKGDGEEFINEVVSISRTSHVNIVTLLGFCLEGSKRALIYEYMPNGSLERYAFSTSMSSENSLSWEKLFDIAIGIARGLEYLHRGCNTRIVHFDIKPHNILLDQYFCPKISDFGLAKLCLNKESAISIGGARGTIGYIAPEVFSKQFGTVSTKSDVYSYGMMVLEMVGARDKKVNADSESSSQYFPQWIYEHLDDYCISASEINGEITELVRKMIVVGLWCIQVIPTGRPTMTRVVEMLEGSTSNLELPPKVLLS
ncbi:LEAF RUST 10 DISEASE-RESISTANCE LOCUS RECEPTOR-LIKE PROTEIN KINASE-like 2.1 isoform X1 [Panicum virgatum]|uniref:LEAF RUST 10 DISEASE-RESISTANCE LOCUS RECEPTOR-LIKE PROTEIN KINASE-like 2.1 isoform X1 n=1 Tax=Panicum virgatum TaxID=38727 RepID=UPI0019D51F58|nr:LEAF RUST 10 DISEASE-RESISTANCE LOCUS RECEPTOR-LIKE PROTEIN KINASE-like 2.1 isoform X1 [Panicum virgatum]